jgi:hypothetical protein
MIIEETPAPVDALIVSTLAEFRPDELAIAQVREFGNLTVATVGIKAVTEARKTVKKIRIAIKKRAQDLNSGALKYQRAINAEMNRLISEIEPIEGRLSAEEENYEAERLKEKQQKEAEKRERLQSRLNRLAAIGVVGVDLNALDVMDDGFFEALLTAETQKAAARKIEEEQLRRDREELQRLRAENERREIEAREAERRAADQRCAEALKPEIEKAEAFGEALLTDARDELERIGNPYWSETAFMEIQAAVSEIVKAVRNTR